MLAYEIAHGVRMVPLSELGDLSGYDDVKEVLRIEALAVSLKRSLEIEPIFVGVDEDGEAWIMEGQHRARAFRNIGCNDIPAFVVVDMEAAQERMRMTERQGFRATSAE